MPEKISRFLNTYRSDATVLGRTGMLYTEGGRSMHIYSELLNGPGLAMWRDSISHWDPPNEREPLGDGDRQRIIGNIRQVVESQNERLDVM